MAIEYTRYRVGSTETERWSPPKTADDARDILKTRSQKMEAPFRIRERGKEAGPERGRIDAITKLFSAIKKDKVGAVYDLIDAKDKVLTVRKIHIKPAVMDTQGTRPVDVAHTAIVHKFPRAHSWGICSCRPVAGSTTPSQHAFCNAEDWNASAKTMKAIAQYLVRNAGKLDVAHVIYDRRIWSRGYGWSSYDGVNPHTDHVHVDFIPQSPGRPCW